MRGVLGLICCALALLLFTMAPARAEREGAGLQVVALPDGNLVVVRVVADSPAARAGLRPGDLLVSVGGRQLIGSDLGKLSRDALWGPTGTPIRLRYMRPGESGTHEVTVVREALGTVPPAPEGVKMLQPRQGQ